MSAGKLNLMILQGKLNLQTSSATVLLSGLNGVVLPLVMSQGRGTAPRSCMARAAHCAASWSVTDTSNCCCCSCCRWCFRAPSTLLNARILVSSHIHRNALRWRGLWMEQTLLSFSFRKTTCKRKATVSAPFFSIFASLFVWLCLVCWSEWSSWLLCFFFLWVYVSFAFSQVTFPGDVGITTRNSTLLSLLPKKISEISKVYVACLACFTAECSSWWSPQLRSCICQKSAWVPEQPTRRQDHIKIPHFIKSI